MDLYFSSTNRGKIVEVEQYIKKYAGNSKIILKGVNDIPENLQKKYNPVENGSSFQENAFIKAKALYDIIQKPVFAEDTGLCVDALDGRPGIYSARYAPDDQSRISKLLNELQGVTEDQRAASFVTALVYIPNAGDSVIFIGRVKGKIAKTADGSKGFGYDPVFISEGETRSFGELAIHEKESISHRGKALSLFMKYLLLNDSFS